MSLDIKTPADRRHGLAVQSTWGTAAADADACIELNCDSFEILPDVRMDQNEAAHGSRERNYANVTPNQNLALPKFSIQGEVNLNEIDHFLYALLQSVTEGASTPYSKVITRHPTQPDFSVNAGHFFTIFEWDAVYARKVKDCIVESLSLSFKAGEKMKYVAGIIARGNPVAATPSGTWTIASRSEYSAGKSPLISMFDRFLIDFAIDGSWVGAVSPILSSLKIDLKRKDVMGVGGASGTDFQSLGVGPVLGNFDYEILKDSNYATVIASLKAGTPLAVRLGKGNAIAGTDAGDLDIVHTGLITEAPSELGGSILTNHIKGEILAASASVVGATITLANAIDRAW